MPPKEKPNAHEALPNTKIASNKHVTNSERKIRSPSYRSPPVRRTGRLGRFPFPEGPRGTNPLFCGF
jgi:hypothetical protein